MRFILWQAVMKASGNAAGFRKIAWTSGNISLKELAKGKISCASWCAELLMPCGAASNTVEIKAAVKWREGMFEDNNQLPSCSNCLLLRPTKARTLL